MIVALAAAVLAAGQGAPIGSAAWKERHQPDMPRLAPCDPGEPFTLATSLRQLPPDVVIELRRFFRPGSDLADAGEPFNSTDVIEDATPQRRFVRAYHVRGTWIVWYEHGGLGYHLQTLALMPIREGFGPTPVLRAVPGSSLSGDLCAATRALLAGVRAASDL